MREDALWLQMLIAAVDENTTTMAARMRLEADAIVVNQCNENAYSEYFYDRHRIRCFHSDARGVGLSRNTALQHAEAPICLFSDEDIVYTPGYARNVLDAFVSYPKADLLLFNVRQSEGRETYHIETFGRVRWYNYGRYPTYAIAVKTERVRAAGVTFSLLFGGGAKYSNGEDSLFLHDCLKKRLRIYRVPTLIGEETARESTWFKGFDEKFFFDRGVLYRYLYEDRAELFGRIFLYRHRETMCAEKPLEECFALMKQGMESVPREDTCTSI